MDKLPQEILMEIFDALPFSERLKCLVVCHTWHNLLNSHLFSRIKIIKDPDLFTKVKSLMRQSLEHAVQVRELVLFYTLPRSFNYGMFWTVFPNLQILEIKYSIIEHWEISIFRPFFTMPYFPHLKQIKLDNISIGLKDLEILHHNMPALQDFQIDHGCLSYSTIPVNIEFSRSIKTFAMSIVKVQDVDTHIQVYQYMLRKYINATKCSCSDFQMHLYDINTQQSIYENDALQFIKLNAPKDPSSLRLASVPNEIDVFRELDTGDYQFDHLEATYCGDDAFFENLVNSGFPSHIRRITLSGTEMKSPDLLQRLPALNSISIFKLGDNLTKYLNGCPKTVRNFRMRCNEFVVSPLDTRMTFIENLELQSVWLTPALCDVISNCFPNLITLKLTGGLTEKVSIVLVNDSLQSVELICWRGRCGFLIGSIKEQRLRYYLSTDGKITRRTYQEIEHLPKLMVITKESFVCSHDVEDV